MPKLLYASTSPYSSKVRMAALYAGIAIDLVPVKTEDKPAELIGANPLGKIPVLVLDDGRSIHDSRAITQHLNRVSKNALLPRNPDKRLEAEVLEALADGICDCALSMVYERRYRPEDVVYQPWLDRQWAKIAAALDLLNANPPKLPKKINTGQIALRVCLGYLALRFAGKWEKGRSRLIRWAARFDEKFPELKPAIPG
ncbi:glutathione S-transferase family protein [Mesorhizobium sp. YC-39]|uniref:glutathione S-transferase family protein n=1 Tax=unclassified Mesorhizobium TaxID=325217 RepID=UPI0021E9306B|nr:MULTISPECIES: glutathione S-transferase family protein [unclassified Mesorhizobium]MCV3210290.1 glutathione S-transferase family protein [Mesorhizobium sp. YC-2]MCV3230820.1 glutathione S-transferase family protein [Mesorhizobium sp. YC-39]